MSSAARDMTDINPGRSVEVGLQGNVTEDNIDLAPLQVTNRCFSNAKLYMLFQLVGVVTMSKLVKTDGISSNGWKACSGNSPAAGNKQFSANL
jgi:hypothetical protein